MLKAASYARLVDYLPKTWRAVNRHVAMPLFESIVLLNIMEVVSSDHNGSLHLHFDNCTSQNSASNGHVACEGALFVNVLALDCFARDFESKTNIPCVPQFLLGYLLL